MPNSGERSRSWKQKNSIDSLSIISNAASTFARARAIGSDSPHVLSAVPTPNISVPSPPMVCHHESAKRSCSRIVLPPMTSSGSKYLNARGFVDVFPSYLILPMPLKNSPMLIHSFFRIVQQGHYAPVFCGIFLLQGTLSRKQFFKCTISQRLINHVLSRSMDSERDSVS